MAKFREDHSRYKKNELGTYLLKKELSKYFENQEKKKKKESNPFVSSIYSSVTSSAIALILYYKFDLGQYLNSLKDDDFKKSILSLVFSLLFTMLFGVLYYLLYNFYHYCIIPMMNFLGAWWKSYRIMNESDLDKLIPKSEQSEISNIEKFNHQVADRVAMVLNIVDNLDTSQPFEEEDVFFVDEAFQSLKKALDILESEIITTKFYYEKINNPDYTKLKKYRIVNLVSVAEKLINKFMEFAEVRDVDFKSDVIEPKSTLYRITEVLKR